MSLLKHAIKDEDYAGKGISQLPAHPQYKTPDMQRKFDELVKDVVAPRYNALVEALAEENAAQHIGVKLQGIAAENVAEALLFLKNTQSVPAGLPEGGAGGQVLVNAGGAPQWKALSAEDIAFADALFESGSVAGALLEAGAKLAAAMLKSGGSFTGRVKAATGTTDNNGEIKNARIANAANNAVLGGTLYIDFRRK